MLMPRKVKHRKHQRGRMKGAAKGGTEVTFKPSSATFTKTEYDFAVLERRLRELAETRLAEEWVVAHRAVPEQTSDRSTDTVEG